MDNTPTTQPKKDNSLAIGLGVGLGLGIPLVAAGVAVFYYKFAGRAGYGSATLREPIVQG